MTNELLPISQYIDKKNYKKALILIKKKNAKSPSALSLELEALCLFNTKHYSLALIKLTEAKKKSIDITQTYSIDKNTIAVLKALKDTKKLISTTTDFIERYPVNKDTHQYRHLLCEQLLKNHQYIALESNAKKLLNSNEFYMQANMYLILCYNHLNNGVNLNSCIRKVMNDLESIPSNLAMSFTDLVFKSNLVENKQAIQITLTTYFQHTNWYKELIKADSPNNNSLIQVNQIPTVENTSLIYERVNKLLNKLTAMGARFSKKISVIENNNELSISANIEANTSKAVIDIPIKCMPLLTDFKISLDKKNTLKATPKKKSQLLNPEAIPIMELMINIYNSSDKIARWKEACPFIALKATPRLLGKITSSKQNDKAINRFLTYLEEGKEEQLVLESFFASRAFAYQQEKLVKSGIKTTKRFEPGLLAIIDLLNHKIGSPSYEYNKDDTHLTIKAPKEGVKGELFVQYNLDDPMMTFLTYGFVDSCITWIYSIPCNIKLANGFNISISTQHGHSKQSEVPNHLHDSLLYFPPNVSKVGNTIELGNCIIPEFESYQTLRRVLNCIITNLIYNNSQAAPDSLIDEVEMKIVAKNIEYWRDLQKVYLADKYKFNNNSKITTELNLLITTYTRHLTQYQHSRGFL